MAWYEIRTMKRQTGGPATGLVADSFAFEATDNAAASNEAYRRASSLKAGQFTVLIGPGNTQIATFEAPDI